MEKDIIFLQGLEEEVRKLREEYNNVLSKPTLTDEDKQYAGLLSYKINSRNEVNRAYHDGQRESNSWTNYFKIVQKENNDGDFEKRCCYAIGDRCGEIEICKLFYSNINYLRDTIEDFNELGPHEDIHGNLITEKDIELFNEKLNDWFQMFINFNVIVFKVKRIFSANDPRTAKEIKQSKNKFISSINKNNNGLINSINPTNIDESNENGNNETDLDIEYGKLLKEHEEEVKEFKRRPSFIDVLFGNTNK